MLLLGLALPALGQAVVQRVEVRLTFEDIVPHPVVQERLEATLQSAAERLLFGRPTDQLLPAQARLGEALSEVVDRIATGYRVAAITVEVGVTSTVTARVRPVGTVIREVEVTTDQRAIHAVLHPLITGLLQRRAIPDVQALYIGTPALAMGWAGPVIEARVRTTIEEALVGYTATFHGVSINLARPDTTTLVELVIAPRDSRVIRNLSVRFRSTSVPILLLDQHAPQVASMAEPLRGVPVVFAQAHRVELERVLDDQLAAYPPATQYHIVASASLEVGETTYITVVADSLLYRGHAEAQLNIGPRAPGPAIVIHFGRLVVARAEAFVETRVIPNTLGLDWSVGGQLDVLPTAVLGVSYTIGAGTVTALTRIQLGRDVGFRGDWNLTNQSFEGGLTYRFNEFLAGELVGTSQGDFWLRLISNL